MQLQAVEDQLILSSNQDNHQQRSSTPFGQLTQATKAAQLQHQVRDPANTLDIVPGLQHNALLSINKFAKANYVTVFMPEACKQDIEAHISQLTQGGKIQQEDFGK